MYISKDKIMVNYEDILLEEDLEIIEKFMLKSLLTLGPNEQHLKNKLENVIDKIEIIKDLKYYPYFYKL